MSQFRRVINFVERESGDFHVGQVVRQSGSHARGADFDAVSDGQ